MSKHPSPDESTFIERASVHERISGAEARVRSLSLLVFEKETSSVFRLPASGRVVVGRGRDADLRVTDRGVSKHHAAIEVDGLVAWIADLGSKNGTRVNGQRIEGSVEIANGAVIAIGSVTLVLRAGGDWAVPRHPLTVAEFRRRTAEELDRAERYHRSLTLACVTFRGTARRSDLEAALERVVRPMDIFAWTGDGALLILLPEVAADDAYSAIGRLGEVLAEVEPLGHLGFANYPTDASEVDALLVEARRRPLASAKDSSGGSKRPYRTFEIGGTSVVVADAAMQRVYTLVGQLAGSHLTVLVHGETGTGKELVANALHHWSPRAAHPFVAVNCAALMESLVDSELFGHEKGSFTGATSSRPGVFERAHGGTVLLDEVGELTPANQAKLLRVLETKRFLRVGGSQDRAIDFRLVSATNRNLEDEVTGGRFRRDLFYRLSAATVWLPPLRERPNELSILAQLFLDEACRAAQQPLKTLTQGAIDALYEYSWPGNIRELKHAMEYVASAVPGSTIEDAHLEHRLAGGLAAATPAPARLRPSTSRRFRPIYEEISEFERKCLADALEETHGNVTRAAALIKMPLRTFQAKMKQFGLSSSESKRGR